MVQRNLVRSSLARSLGSALVVIAAAGLVLGFIELAIIPPGRPHGWVSVVFVVVFWVYLAAGLIAWWRRPSNRMGALIVFGGFAIFAGSLANTTIPVLTEAGVILATLVLAVMLHLLHAFPSGVLRGTASRITVAGGYAVAIVLQAPLYLFAPAGGTLMVADQPELATAGAWLQRGAGLAVMVATAVILTGRLRHAAPAQRRTLLPLFTYGILAVLLIPISANVFEPLGMTPVGRVALQLALLGGIPVAFALAVLRGGFARAGELEELGTWLGSTAGNKPALAVALAETLGDNSLQVIYWVPERGIFVDSDGVPVELPPNSSGRSSVDVELEGRLVGAIAYDAELIADPELVRAAGHVVAIAVDRERLTAQLLSSQRALRKSRLRLVEAADGERRRIAQDLHDGLQVQLVLLALEAQQLALGLQASDDMRAKAVGLREGIDSAAGDLRQLVHAVMPSALIERGLSAATEDLVDRMPVPTELELGITDNALPAPIERTAYFVVAEGLSNAVKHSRAASCLVRLKRDDSRLLIEVRDNGIGGASISAGTGLRGLGDRVDALGGRMHIDSEYDRGTHLRVELPCG